LVVVSPQGAVARALCQFPDMIVGETTQAALEGIVVALDLHRIEPVNLN
jgi:hypothetical protein